MFSGNSFNMRTHFVASASILLCSFLLACSGAVSKQQPTAVQPGDALAAPANGAAEEKAKPLVLTGPGTVQAYNTVTVKSRIDGQILRVVFREGQDVKKGDLLVLIDPASYETALSQMQANLFRDENALQDARKILERDQKLYEANVIARQPLDTQKAAVGQLEGTVQADKAQVDAAKLNLAYTRVTSPVDGHVGLRLVDVGNMVRSSDSNGLVVITQLQPIAVLFALPEQSLPDVVQHMRDRKRLQVEVYTQDGQTKLATGDLLTVDNQIDATTNTAKLKAVFDNRNRRLWPNQSVEVRLLLGGSGE